MEDTKISIIKTENLVIGSGVFGLSVAKYLSDSNEEVILVDKSFCPKEASYYALGRIDPILGGAGHGNETKPLEVAKMSFEAYKKFIELDENVKNKIELEIKPTLHFYKNDSEFKAIRKVIDVIDYKREYFSLESLDISNKNFEFSNKKYHKKIAKFDGTIFINSKKYREELFKQFSENHSQYITDEINKVTSFNKYVEVEGINNVYKANKVILATGPWTNLIEGVNLKKEIFPSKGQIIKLHDKEKSFTDYHLHGPCSLVRKKDGLIWVAATVEDKGFDKEITENSKKELLKKAKEMYPSISDFEFHSQTACLRPSINNDLPFIDKIPNEEIYIASGGGGWGIMMSIMVGEILYEILKKS